VDSDYGMLNPGEILYQNMDTVAPSQNTIVKGMSQIHSRERKSRFKIVSNLNSSNAAGSPGQDFGREPYRAIRSATLD